MEPETQKGSINYLNIKIRRLQKGPDHYKKEAREALTQNKHGENNPLVEYKEDLIFISLSLFLNAHISFRAVSRVLGVLSGWLGLLKAPCPQTIINRIMRLSIARTFNANLPICLPMGGVRFSNGRIWMIDISIALGAGKILAFLECQKILKRKGLSQESYRECQPWIEHIPLRSQIRRTNVVESGVIFPPGSVPPLRANRF